MKDKCIAIVMEQARKLRKLVNKENPVEKNLNFLKVMGNESYRHSMDDLYTASSGLNKSCNKAKVIIEMQWWRLIKQKSLLAIDLRILWSLKFYLNRFYVPLRKLSLKILRHTLHQYFVVT